MHIEYLNIEEESREFWLPVVGFEGLYEVSNLGRVNSLARQTKGTCDVCTRQIKGGIMALSYYSDGYRKVTLKKNLQSHVWRVHRLVAMAFIPNLDNKPQINHINGVKDDNRVENLEWCTAKENTQHIYRTGLKIPSKGSDNKLSICVVQYDKDGEPLRKWGSIGEAVTAGYDYSCISGCLRGKHKTHKGYIWRHCNAA